jgi:hypothetical protein
VFIAGCAPKSLPEFPDCGIDTQRMNNEISIILAQKPTDYSKTRMVNFFIVLNKNITVVAPIDFNSTIFILDESTNEWVEVENGDDYEDNFSFFTLDESTGEWVKMGNGTDNIGGWAYRLDSSHSKELFNVFPQVDKGIRYSEVYICIKGLIVENDVLTNQVVGASVHVSVKP